MRYSRSDLEHALRRGRSDGSRSPLVAEKAIAADVESEDGNAEAVESEPSALEPCSQVGSSCIAPDSNDVAKSSTSVYSAFIDLTSSGTGTKCADLCDDSGAKPPTVLFYIVGKVDGLSTQLDLRSDDATQWREMQVVVEVKNRLGRIAAEPPLYDQIQLVTYMLMLGCQFGDLVQAVSSLRPAPVLSISSALPLALVVDPGTSELPPVSPASAATKVTRKRDFNSAAGDRTESPPKGITAVTRGAAASTVDFAVSRVALNEAPYFHKDNFFGIIAPRLKVTNRQPRTKSANMARYDPTEQTVHSILSIQYHDHATPGISRCGSSSASR
jgi:hypothetical protein